jgi:hypothetical protein
MRRGCKRHRRPRRIFVEKVEEDPAFKPADGLSRLALQLYPAIKDARDLVVG